MIRIKGMKYKRTAQVLRQQTDIGNVTLTIVYAAGSSPDYVSKVELDDV